MRAPNVGRWRGKVRPGWPSYERAPSPTHVALEPFSTRVPPDLLERLRVAAPQLDPRQGEIAVAAIDRFPTEYGF